MKSPDPTPDMNKDSVLQRALPLLRFLLLVLWVCSCRGDENGFDWSKSLELYPGIRHALVALQEPRLMKIHAVRVDLTRKDLAFHTTPRDPGWGKAMPDSPQHMIRTKRQRTRDYLKQARQAAAQGGYGLNMVLAVNAAPWVPWTRPFTHTYADQLGLAVSDGELVCPGNSRPSLLIFRDGTFAMDSLPENADLSTIRLAVSGFSFVLRNGQVSGDQTLHPRTGYGLSQNRKFLFLITIDGRQKGWSEGAGSREVGEWLKHFGAWDGINMDGGGSTSLAYLVPGEKQETIRLLNQPPGGERKVGSNLGIYLLDEEKR